METVNEILCLANGLRVRAIREESREVDFVASTDTIDSYGERVEQKWDLSRYKSNPTVLYAHDRWDLPIGICTAIGVKNGQLECTIRFSEAELNPKAEQVWQNVRAKVLRAVSVGFRPHSIRIEREDDRDILILSDNELYEISVVPVPANPDALAKMRTLAARGGANRDTKEPSATGAKEQAMQIDNAKTPAKKPDAEPNMAEPIAATLIAQDTSAIERALSDSQDAVRSLTESCAKLTTDKAALETELAATSEARDKAIERAKAAEDKLIELEIEALVGKTIKPTEKEDFVRLRKESPELCASMLAKRAPLDLLAPVVPPEGSSAGDRALKKDAGAALWNKVAVEGD